MPRSPQLTGDDAEIMVERLRALWRSLELIEKVAVAAALERQPRFDSLLDEFDRHKQAQVTIGMVARATAEVVELLDPSRRRPGWLKLMGGRAANEPDATEGEARPVGGNRAEEGTKDDSNQAEAMLMAIRESLSVVEMFIAIKPQSPGLAEDLVDRRTQPLGEEHLRRLRAAAELVCLACATVLETLQDTPEETSN